MAQKTVFFLNGFLVFKRPCGNWVIALPDNSEVLAVVASEALVPGAIERILEKVNS